MACCGGGALDREAVERRLGLDVPVYVQYGRWMGDIFLRGSLGESLMGRRAVEEKIIEAILRAVRAAAGTRGHAGNED